MINFQI